MPTDYKARLDELEKYATESIHPASVIVGTLLSIARELLAERDRLRDVYEMAHRRQLDDLGSYSDLSDALDIYDGEYGDPVPCVHCGRMMNKCATKKAVGYGRLCMDHIGCKDHLEDSDA